MPLRRTSDGRGAVLYTGICDRCLRIGPTTRLASEAFSEGVFELGPTVRLSASGNGLQRPMVTENVHCIEPCEILEHSDEGEDEPFMADPETPETPATTCPHCGLGQLGPDLICTNCGHRIRLHEPPLRHVRTFNLPALPLNMDQFLLELREVAAHLDRVIVNVNPDAAIVSVTTSEVLSESEHRAITAILRPVDGGQGPDQPAPQVPVTEEMGQVSMGTRVGSSPYSNEEIQRFVLIGSMGLTPEEIQTLYSDFAALDIGVLSVSAGRDEINVEFSVPNSVDVFHRRRLIEEALNRDSGLIGPMAGFRDPTIPQIIEGLRHAPSHCPQCEYSGKTRWDRIADATPYHHSEPCPKCEHQWESGKAISPHEHSGASEIADRVQQFHGLYQFQQLRHGLEADGLYQFQQLRHGLEADGIFGPATRQAMIGSQWGLGTPMGSTFNHTLFTVLAADHLSIRLGVEGVVGDHVVLLNQFFRNYHPVELPRPDFSPWLREGEEWVGNRREVVVVIREVRENDVRVFQSTFTSRIFTIGRALFLHEFQPNFQHPAVSSIWWPRSDRRLALAVEVQAAAGDGVAFRLCGENDSPDEFLDFMAFHLAYELFPNQN